MAVKTVDLLESVVKRGYIPGYISCVRLDRGSEKPKDSKTYKKIVVTDQQTNRPMGQWANGPTNQPT